MNRILTNKQRRYAAVIDFYVYAESEAQAAEEAAQICRELRDEHDNKASLCSVAQAEFGEVKTTIQ